MEEVQKNENGTTVPQTDGKPEKEKKPKRELTPQQVQQRRKMIVFPLMFLAFAPAFTFCHTLGENLVFVPFFQYVLIHLREVELRIFGKFLAHGYIYNFTIYNLRSGYPPYFKGANVQKHSFSYKKSLFNFSLTGRTAL